MRTFATKEKRLAPAVHNARPYVHHPIGPVQQAQQAAMGKILRPDEVQAKPDIVENDGKYEQETNHAVAELPVPAISGMPPGGAAPLQRSENEEPEEELQRQPEEEEEEPIQAKLIQRQPDNEEEEEPVQAKRIQRQMADMGGIQTSRFGFIGSEVKAQQAEISRILRSTGAQAKLTIGQPNDKYEQEADRVADQVMRMSDTDVAQRQLENEEEEETLQAKPLAESITPLVQREEVSEEEEDLLQAKATSEHTPQVSPEISNNIQCLKGGGQPLSSSDRSFFEPRFGQDFSQVRFHTNAKAASTAKAVNARAFTLGQDVVFGAGEYALGTVAGDRLLAHELTHTLQQGQGGRTIQRSLKFEIQTNNYVWAIRDTGLPNPKLLPRKYASTSVGFREGAGEERGDRPAYLALGHKGGPARKRGEAVFIEAEGPRVTEEAKSGIDPSKKARFVREYRFSKAVDVDAIVGKPVTRGQLKLVSEIDNADLPAMSGKFNDNTFEFIYQNTDGTRLDVHLDKDRRFARGHVKFMKVGRRKPRGIDKIKAAQYEETWKVTVDPGGPVDFLGNRAKVERVAVVNNSKDSAMKGAYNSNTWEKSYFKSTDFSGDVLSDSATRLEVHMDEEGRLRSGHVKFMRKSRINKAKEQTAIEVQSEHGGYIEFETPKWFRNWSEIEERIQEAVDITKAMNSQRGTAKEITDPTILSAIDARKTSSALGKIVEWPEAFSTAHLKNLRKNKRRLLVQIVDDTWFARIQASEGIDLSEYETLLKENEEPFVRDIAIPSADHIFTAAFSAAKLKDSTLNENLFANLKGFLQLIVTYIFRGQVKADKNPKATFMLMARTNFGSMYKVLLSADEKALFKTIVGDPKNPSNNPILTELETPINTERGKLGWGSLTLTRETRFFFRKVGTESKTSGPAIHDWLANIAKGKDLLSGKLKGISDAMSTRSVTITPGDKDFKHAQFEIRGTVGHSGTITHEGKVRRFGNDRPASEWISYAKGIFDSAQARSADTPDDPSTPKVDESSKTGLKG